MKNEDGQEKIGEEWVIRAEKAVVIIYDTWGKRFLMQQKDAGYPIAPFRHMYSFLGASMKLEPKKTPIRAVVTEKLENLSDFFGSKLKLKPEETPRQALEKRLSKELKAVHTRVAANMQYWKMLRLPYGSGIDGEYTCHVFVVMTDKRGLDDLKYDTEGDGGIRHGSLAVIHRQTFEHPNSGYSFMASFDGVMREFLRELDISGVQQFLKKLKKEEN
jgi:hypothetical protein